MEERNGNGVQQSDDHNTGTWVLALRGPGEGYLGRVAALDGEYAYEVDGPDGQHTVTETRTEVPVSEVLAAKTVTLCPVYDYRERVREIPIPGPDGKPMMDPQVPFLPALQPMRTPLVMPLGFTLEPAPVHIPGAHTGTVFRFLSQMDRRDAETYRNFAKDTRQSMRQARMQASNLQMPSADDIAAAARSKA